MISFDDASQPQQIIITIDNDTINATFYPHHLQPHLITTPLIQYIKTHPADDGTLDDDSTKTNSWNSSQGHPCGFYGDGTDSTGTGDQNGGPDSTSTDYHSAPSHHTFHTSTVSWELLTLAKKIAHQLS